mmetsp:Transcript_16721/g.39998  ORF Transcript_16721/g.39998 Transcript_16721/m.39998 type:complete len:339 (+) Transcript_16721:734-1750(+)
MVAWYASGPKGLMVLDLLMLLLFFGLLIAYEVAMVSFIADTPISTGSRKIDIIIPSIIVAILSCAKDISYLSKFSILGLLAVALSFIVISWQGFEKHGISGFYNISELNIWPTSLSAASSWFGVVVFGYGTAPFVFNFRNSMTLPKQINQSLQIGLLMVYIGFLLMSNGIRILFSSSQTFDGDILQVMPNTHISAMVRILMTGVVALTGPLIAIPCGELIEGKLFGLLAVDSDGKMRYSFFEHRRIVVRVLVVATCTIFSAFLGSGFVDVVSFIGCFCVAIAGLVLPPLFCIQLSLSKSSSRHEKRDSMLIYDSFALVLGIVVTVISSVLTFRELMNG